MKLFRTWPSLIVFSLSGVSNAKIWLDPVSLVMNVKDVRNITWQSDRDYNYQLLLVEQVQGGWNSVATVFKDRELLVGNHSYNWTVPNVQPEAFYALHLTGTNIPNDGSGYSNLTNWFVIKGGDEATTRDVHCDGCGYNHGKWAGKVAGAVIGTVIGICLLSWLLVWAIRSRRARRTRRPSAEEPLPEDPAGPLEDDDSIRDFKTGSMTSAKAGKS